MKQYIVLIVVGIIAGNITGLIGASGVSVIVPAIVFLGYLPSQAIGASLFIDTVASLIVAWTYYQNKHVKIKESIGIAVGSVLGAQVGSLISPKIPALGLNSAFSVFLLLSAAIFWFRGKYGIQKAKSIEERHTKISSFLHDNRKPLGWALGFLTGITSGILGTSGGLMILLILVILMRYEMHEAIGTSTLIMAFTAASGAIGHALSSDLPIGVAMIGAIGTVIGGRIAAKYANRISEKVLCRIAAIVFFALSAAMFMINKRFIVL
jgi:uncharacterized membrane protein YfcA